MGVEKASSSTAAGWNRGETQMPHILHVGKQLLPWQQAVAFEEAKVQINQFD